MENTPVLGKSIAGSSMSASETIVDETRPRRRRDDKGKSRSVATEGEAPGTEERLDVLAKTVDELKEMMMLQMGRCQPKGSEALSMTADGM